MQSSPRELKFCGIEQCDFQKSTFHIVCKREWKQIADCIITASYFISFDKQLRLELRVENFFPPSSITVSLLFIVKKRTSSQQEEERKG